MEGPFGGVPRGFRGSFQGSGGSCLPYLGLGHLFSHFTTPDQSQIFNLVKSLIHFIQEASKLFFFLRGQDWLVQRRECGGGKERNPGMGAQAHRSCAVAQVWIERRMK